MEHIYYTAIYRLQGSARLVVCTQSRELERYRSPSPAARAAAQLAEAGKSLRPGQSVRLVYTLGEPGVRAWDAPGSF